MRIQRVQSQCCSHAAKPCEASSNLVTLWLPDISQVVNEHSQSCRSSSSAISRIASKQGVKPLKAVPLHGTCVPRHNQRPGMPPTEPTLSLELWAQVFAYLQPPFNVDDQDSYGTVRLCELDPLIAHVSGFYSLRLVRPLLVTLGA